MISLIVFAVVIIACCAGIASADDLTYGDLKYTVSNNQVTITGYVGEPTAIIVPQEINETPIIKIGNRAFQSCNSLLSIQISEGIEELGQYAFQNCKNLTTVELPNSLTTIGSGAFSGCSNLSSWNYPRSLTSCDSTAIFNGCISLTQIIVPEGVTKIPNWTFNKASGLTSVTLPSTLTEIGSSAFKGCTGLTSIAIPDSVTTIGDYAFSGCSNLSSWNYPRSLTSCGSNAILEGCTSLTQVIVPEGVTKISNWTFNKASSLTSVTLPSTLTEIGSYAFKGCTGLASIAIPDSVAKIGVYAFSDCSNLSSWNYPRSLTSCGPNAMFDGCTSLTQVIVPEGVTKIPDWTFMNGSGLTSVALPSTLTEIGNDAFYGCTGLTSIVIPDSVTKIGSYAFKGCTGFTSIVIPDGVTTIGGYAFSDCSNLSSWNYPRSLTSCGPNAMFDGCTSLTQVIVPEGVTKIPDWTFNMASSLTSVTLPSTLTEIGSGAFKGCTGLTGIVIPDSVTKIGSYAFSDCSNLSSWNYPRSLTSCVSNGMLEGCSSLIQVIVPEGVTKIPDWTFTKASSLTSVTLPSTLTEIGSNAFRGCTGLTSIVIPDSVTTIGGSAFVNCNNLLYLLFNCNKPTISSNAIPDTAGIYYYHGTSGWSESDGSMYCGFDGTTVTLANIVYFDAQDPTCEEDGFSAHFGCLNCGCCFTDGTATAFLDPSDVFISALGHLWGKPAYTWAADNSRVSATHVCSRDPAHTETETVTVNTEITKQPTCTEMGDTTYTSAAFINPAFEVQTKTLTDVPALGHEWGEPAYTWAQDNSAVTAIRVCIRDAEHTETGNAAVTSKITKQATCTEMGETTYTSAAFANTGFSVQTKTLADIPALGHSWGEPVYTWAEDHTSLTANHTCVRDASHQETETVSVISEVTNEPTCTEMGSTTYTGAGFTNLSFTAQSETLINVPALGHDWKAATYDWNDDHTTVTATHVCSRDASHAETETVAVTKKITKQPTCTAMGKTKYTSKAFANSAFSMQTLTLTDIPVNAEAHQWGEPVYTWAENNLSVTAQRTCTYNAAHQEQETVSASRKLFESPTDTEAGSHGYISAAFANPAFTVQEKAFTIPALNTISVLRLPTDLQRIEEEAFAGSPTQAVLIPEGCSSVGDEAFANCHSLIYVRIPTSIDDITEEAFAGCDLDQIILDQDGNLYQLPSRQPYTLYLNANGGSCTTTSLTAISGKAIGTLPTPTREGYTFNGWFTAASGGTEVSETTSFKNVDSVTLYAAWTAETYTVTYNANGGTVSPAGKTVTYDSTYGSLAAPTQSGFTFLGWFTSIDSGTQVTAGTKVTTAADHTIWAHWRADTCVVTYDANGGTVSPSGKTVNYNGVYGTLATPTRTGCTFDGWYTTASGGTAVTSDTTVTSTIDHTIYAHWAFIPYTVTFNANGGSVSSSSKTVIYDSTYGTLITPTRTGYTFNGWYTAASGGTKITAGTKVTSAENHTLYAHWTANEYTVTYNANGLTVTPATKQVTYDSTYGALATPTWTGYTFDGWVLNETLVISSTKVTTAADHILTAYWMPNSYTVTYNANGGSVSTSGKTVWYDNPYGDLATPTRTGYTFDGWYTAQTGGTKVTNASTVKTTANHTLYAHWTANQYTYSIVYQSSHGTRLGTSSEKKTFGTTNTVTAPAYTGYITPSSQSVAWDATSKTITFTYVPETVSFTSKSGNFWGNGHIRYSAEIQYQNRTADSVQVRVMMTLTRNADSTYSAYRHTFFGSIGEVSVPSTTVVPFNAWRNKSSTDLSRTGTSNWVTVPLTTTGPASLTLHIELWQYNSSGTKMTSTDFARINTNWTVAIPAY